jgi:sugar phosphate isomerase/epimerase
MLASDVSLPAMSSPFRPDAGRRQLLTGLLLAPTLPAALGRAASPAPRFQIGCYTRPWADFEPRVALDAIAAAGYKFAGLMSAKGGLIVGPATAPEKIAALGAEAKARGLAISSIYGGDFLVPKSPAESVARLQKLIDHCVLCGCPSLLLGGTGKAELVAPYYETVTACCAYAAAKGVGLTVKPHGGTNATGPECRKLIASVGHPAFRLWYDPGNIFYYSDGRRDPVDDAATVDGLVVGMSVKDFLPPKEVNVTPGTGKVDFPQVLRRLRQGGFTQGPLVVECLARGDPDFVLAEARRARLFLESLTA